MPEKEPFRKSGGVDFEARRKTKDETNYDMSQTKPNQILPDLRSESTERRRHTQPREQRFGQWIA
jgi:hypothetical protein